MNCIKFSGVVTIDQLTICNGSDMYGIRCCVMVHYTLNVPCWDYTSLKIEQIKDNLVMLLRRVVHVSETSGEVPKSVHDDGVNNRDSFYNTPGNVL